MLSFEVRSLAVQAAKVEGELAPDDEVWLPEDARPDAPIQVTGRVSAAGNDRFYFSGRLAGTATLDCRRCLTPVAVAVTTDVAAIFSDGSADEDSDDPDIFPLADGGKRVDLRPAIREQWVLNAPAYAECRPDCKGICPTCGADLNAGACSCAPATDSRWDALRATRSRAH
jgi:uncharacterized protein